MAKTQQAKEKTQTAQDKKNVNLEEDQSTQTPASSQAGYNQPQGMTRSGKSQDQRLSRYQRSSPMSPFGFMRRFSEEMDRLFDDFGSFGSLIPSGFGQSSASVWSPQTEIFERDGNLVIQTDLPGMSKDDINVSIEDDQITIRGERRNENEQTEEGFYHSERSYGSFYRSFPIPQNINTDQAKANFKNGVLEITIPLPEETESKGRKIEISEENS